MRKINVLISAVYFLFVASGCDHDINTMITNYNSKFPEAELIYDDDAPSPGEPGFIEEEMLEPVYFVKNTDSFELIAPKNCAAYTWNVTLPRKGENYTESVEILEYAGGKNAHSREFVIFIPYSGLQTGKTYNLSLTVEDKYGKKYRDTCGLIIYEPYD